MVDLNAHAEAILRAAFPSMNFEITTIAARQPRVIAAVTALAEEAYATGYEAGQVRMRERAAEQCEKILCRDAFHWALGTAEATAIRNLTPEPSEKDTDHDK